jgi:hypothetical protein
MITPILLAAFLVAQAPTPAPATAALKARREAELQRTVERKRSQSQKKAAQRTAKAQRAYQDAIKQQAYQAKMAPVWAAQRATQARLAIEQQRANAMSSIANSVRQEVVIDQTRLRVEQRQAGIPFLPTPNGMKPYPFASGATP